MGKDESHLAVAFSFFYSSVSSGSHHHVPQKVLYPGMAGASLVRIVKTKHNITGNYIPEGGEFTGLWYNKKIEKNFF